MPIRILDPTLFLADVDLSARFNGAAGLQLCSTDESGYPCHYAVGVLRVSAGDNQGSVRSYHVCITSSTLLS